MDDVLLILLGLVTLSGIGVGKLARRKQRSALYWGGPFALAFGTLLVTSQAIPSLAVESRLVVGCVAFGALGAMILILLALGRLPLPPAADMARE